MPPSTTELVASFRANGMKITPQRRLLCELIAGADDHPTVETLYHRAARSMPTISLKTVYTTLTELADLGLIKLTRLDTGSLRVDHEPAPHAHLLCSQCGHIVDHPLEAFPEPPAGALNAGFQIEEQVLVYRGRCANCRKAGISKLERM